MFLYVKFHQRVRLQFDECIPNLANERNFIILRKIFHSSTFLFHSPSLSNEEITVLNAAYDDGQVTCQFSFEITTEQVDGEPTPIGVDKNYYLIFAAGSLKNEGRLFSFEYGFMKNSMYQFCIHADEIAKHSFTFITSQTYQLQIRETINLDEFMVNFHRETFCKILNIFE